MSIRKKYFSSAIRAYRLLSVLLVATLFTGWAVFTARTAAGPSDDARGWGWNAYQPQGSTDKLGLGWISMSCFNDFDNDGDFENQCALGGLARPYSLEIALGVDATLNGVNDYVQGCAWSSAYGWICFNGGTGWNGAQYQCDESQLTNPDACADLSTSGVAINASATKHCSITRIVCTGAGDCPNQGAQTQTCDPDYFHLASPAYSSGAFGAITSNTQRATILSLWTSTDKEKSYIAFPFTTAVPATPVNNLYGCTQCDQATGKCGACLSVNTDTVEDATNNPSPNILCWNCGNGTACTVNEQGGSCVANRDKNSCTAASCTACASYTGVLVNKNSQGSYEMCGWGYHAFDGSGSLTNTIATVDNGGEGPSMAISPVDNLPFIVYRMRNAADSNRWYIKITKCGDPFCTIKSSRFIEPIDSVGLTAVAIGADNKPVIAYYNDFANRMTVVKCNDANCSTSGTPLNVETITIGLNEPSMIMPADGKAVMSYYGEGGHLKVFKCDTSDCTSGSTWLVDNAVYSIGELDHNSSIALDTSDGLPIISYFESSTANLMFVHCTLPTCETFSAPVSVDTTGTGGGYYHTSMVVPPDGKPIITYTDRTSGVDTLKVARCTNDMCTGSDLAIIPGTSDALYMSIALGADSMPVISYSAFPGADLKVAKCSSLTCASGVALQTIDSSNGQEGHLRILSDGSPAIAYHDPGLIELRYAICSSGSCAAAQLKGLGWIAFNPKGVGGPAYSEGLGNIFSGGNIYSPIGPPVAKYNAAYILEATGSITNWFSSNQYKYPNIGSAPTYLNPGGVGGQTQVYGNVLAKLDYQGIVTDVATGVEVSSGSQTGTNKYGGLLRYRSPATDHGLIDANALDNRVLYWKATVANPVVTIDAFTLNCQATKSGAGIIVVDGDLAINGNIEYDLTDASPSCATGLTKLKEIASLVWIVRGDVTINSAVTKIAGTFVILGDGAPATCPALSSSASSGCGRFSTGSSANPFTSSGAIIARQFNLQRSYAGSSGPAPAELFVTDGRFQSNPPAGLTDFSKSVPRFTVGF